MPDGTSQFGFGFSKIGASSLRPGEIVVDLFAGGGGASEAMREAIGVEPYVAINHDRWAVGMHAANHPMTRHRREDIWEADPKVECGGRKVGWLHASPDCRHFSQAKGGQPRSREIRSLSWVVLKWAGKVHPRICSLENVRQIEKWAPLIAKRDPDTGRVVKLDGAVAAKGERVPVEQQFLVPDKRRAGRTWRRFLAELRGLGYTVEHRLLKACDYGAGTSRERLFLIARRDGEPICWPAPSHGPGRIPYVTAADCIDWSIPCPSVFERKRPLAEATCKRIARGIKRYVLDATEPFIVPNNSNNVPKGVRQPVPTITTCGGRNLLVVPTLIQASHGEGSGPTKRRGSGAHDVAQPLGTIHAGGGSFAVAEATLLKVHDQDVDVPAARSIAAFLDQANGGGPHGRPPRSRSAAEPVSAITGSGSQQRIVTANLAKLRGTSSAADCCDPLATISAGGEHHAVVECMLSRQDKAGALRVAAFLIRYYGEGGQWGDLNAPLDTITTRDRMALVTVHIQGEPFVIVDIGLRMLAPPELFRAQGFPPNYVFDRMADGTKLTATQQVRLVGNSVSPPPMAALVRANVAKAEQPEAMAA